MFKHLRYYALAASLLLPLYGHTSVDHNVEGLPPMAKTNLFQSCSRLKVISVFGIKIYTDDEQAKFSPIDYAVSWGCLHNLKLPGTLQSISITVI